MNKRIVALLLALMFAAGAAAQHAVPAPAADISSYPDGWRAYFIDEPVFNGRLYIVEAGVGNKQTVVLVHGLGDNGLNDWLNTIPALADHFHVVAFDLPGFGRSDSGSGLYSPSNYSRLIHWLAGRLAKGKVIAIGHSLGGAIVLRYAHDYQHEVEKLALVDAAGILQRTVFTKHLARLTRAYQARLGRVGAWLADITRRVDSLSERLLEAADAVPDWSQIILNNEMARGYLLKDHHMTHAAMALINEDFSKAISEVKVPTRIIWGGVDSVAPLRTGILLAGRMPDATLTVMEGVNHVPMKQAPAAFNALLRGALVADQTGERIRAPRPQAVNDDFACRGQSGVRINGPYRRIDIQGCEQVMLQDVFARSLTVSASRVILENVKIVARGTALSARQSVIEGTLVRLLGALPLQATESRIDLAGSSLVSDTDRAMALEGSAVYFSVSDASTNGRSRYLHGIVAE
ncbi:MAG TPA: alpha/beta hydrolase [Gammaproteobacteria bacterium]|nr:alpha/beta hydrolase [Gammaproteobacteria bacterium]